MILKNAATLKTRSRVTQDHQTCHHSIACLVSIVSYQCLIVILSLECIVVEKFTLERYHDLQTWIKQRNSKQFDIGPAKISSPPYYPSYQIPSSSFPFRRAVIPYISFPSPSSPPFPSPNLTPPLLYYPPLPFPSLSSSSLLIKVSPFNTATGYWRIFS